MKMGLLKITKGFLQFYNKQNFALMGEKVCEKGTRNHQYFLMVWQFSRPIHIEAIFSFTHNITPYIVLTSFVVEVNLKSQNKKN